MNNNINTLVLNLFAGPGAGKTTCAWELASQLKKLGIEAEYVGEYAKDLVWDGRTDMLDGTEEHQTEVFREQARRVQRLIGKVEVIVTDSPILLQSIYGNTSDGFKETVLQESKKYNNLNFFIERGQDFQQRGRIHNREQSIELDNKIKSLLERTNTPYKSYNHDTIRGAAVDVVFARQETNFVVVPQNHGKYDAFSIVSPGELLENVLDDCENDRKSDIIKSICLNPNAGWFIHHYGADRNVAIKYARDRAAAEDIGKILTLEISDQNIEFG